MNTSTRRLVSTDLCFVPGLLAFCRALRATDLDTDARDRAARFFMVAQTFPALTGREIEDLLAGRFTVDGEDVVFLPPVDESRDRSVDAGGNKW